MSITVAIVGGGFSGTMLAVHLLRQSDNAIKIKLIERSPALGRGIAYGTLVWEHLLNVPAAKMSAFADKPNHFLEWAQSQSGLGSVEPGEFLPRRVYGTYIESILDSAQQLSSSELERIEDEAISIKTDQESATVTLKSGRAIVANFVVLALGNFPPSDPVVKENIFYTSPKYVSYAWSTEALKPLPINAPVLLIGSGLTMVDLAVALLKRGHKGKIELVSRRGLLPQVHKAVTPYKQFLAVEDLPKTIRALLHRIRDEVKKAAIEGYDWRAVIDAIRPATQKIWQALPIDEKKRFLRHVRPYWEVHRHRVAPEVGGIIAEAISRGQVRLLTGRIRAYEETEEHVKVFIKRKQTLEVITAQRVINCTGPECDYRKFQHPLTINLLEQGLAHPDPLALGLEVNQEGALVDSKGEISNLIYTLGPPLKGLLWETTAVPEIRGQAAELARQLLTKSLAKTVQ